MQFKDIRFQHLYPRTADFRGQLWTNGKQPRSITNIARLVIYLVRLTIEETLMKTSMWTYEWNIEASINFSLELKRARPKRIDTG